MAIIKSLSFDPSIIKPPLGSGDTVPGIAAISSIGTFKVVEYWAGTANMIEYCVHRNSKCPFTIFCIIKKGEKRNLQLSF